MIEQLDFFLVKLKLIQFCLSSLFGIVFNAKLEGRRVIWGRGRVRWGAWRRALHLNWNHIKWDVVLLKKYLRVIGQCWKSRRGMILKSERRTCCWMTASYWTLEMLIPDKQYWKQRLTGIFRNQRNLRILIRRIRESSIWEKSVLSFRRGRGTRVIIKSWRTQRIYLNLASWNIWQASWQPCFKHNCYKGTRRDVVKAWQTSLKLWFRLT